MVYDARQELYSLNLKKDYPRFYYIRWQEKGHGMENAKKNTFDWLTCILDQLTISQYENALRSKFSTYYVRRCTYTVLRTASREAPPAVG